MSASPIDPERRAEPQARMAAASSRLDEAMWRCDVAGADDTEATARLLLAVTEHSRALAALLAAHLEAGR